MHGDWVSLQPELPLLLATDLALVTRRPERSSSSREEFDLPRAAGASAVRDDLERVRILGKTSSPLCPEEDGGGPDELLLLDAFEADTDLALLLLLLRLLPSMTPREARVTGLLASAWRSLGPSAGENISEEMGLVLLAE